jgi:4-carboxymuconolactone decarboxylase
MLCDIRDKLNSYAVKLPAIKNQLPENRGEIMYNESRLPKLLVEEMTPEQRKIHDIIAAPRGGVISGPYPAWVHFPELCTVIYKMLDILTTKSSLDKKTREIITMAVARVYGAQHIWCSHTAKAMACGLNEELLNDINNRCVCSFENDRDRIAFEIATTIASGHLLSQKIYDDAVAIFGLEAMIEISTYIGYYLMVGAVLNMFDVRVKSEENTLIP